MRKINVVVMTLAGLLLIVASVLKFQEMLTTCVPSWTDNKYGFWESYEFFLIQIPLEFALGVWMVSGLFRKAAWIAGTVAYFFFIFVTIFKVVTGAESCGCFGQVHVNPWVTLFAIDVPIFLLLAIFRPRGLKLLPPPWPNVFYLLAVAVPTIGLMVVSTPVLVAFKPECIKPEQVQPDESAKKALQEYLRKQKEAREKAEQQSQPQTQQTEQPVSAESEQTNSQEPFIKELTYGKLRIEAADLNDTFNIYVGDKQAIVIYAGESEKILITPVDPAKQHIVASARNVEINWGSAAIAKEGTLAEPNDATVPVAAAQGAQTQSERREGGFEERRFGPPMEIDPAMAQAVAERLMGGNRESGEGQEIEGPQEAKEPAEAADSNEAQTMPSGDYVVREDIDQTDDQSPQEPNEAAEWKWMQHVVEEDVRAKLSEGLVVVLMYHHDCEICAEWVPKYSNYYKQMTEQGSDEFKMAFLAVPPYGEAGPVPADTTCITGKLTDKRNWEVMSPYVVALLDGQLVKTWKEGTAPEPDKLLDEIFAE